LFARVKSCPFTLNLQLKILRPLRVLSAFISLRRDKAAVASVPAAPPPFPGARLCLKDQPQHLRTYKPRSIFPAASVTHTLRLVLRTQSRSARHFGLIRFPELITGAGSGPGKPLRPLG